MSVRTLRVIKHREYRVAGLGRNVAIRADSLLRSGLDVHNLNPAIINRQELGCSFSEPCRA